MGLRDGVNPRSAALFAPLTSLFGVGAGQSINAIIFGVPAVAAHPVPGDTMRPRGFQPSFLCSPILPVATRTFCVR